MNQILDTHQRNSNNDSHSNLETWDANDTDQAGNVVFTSENNSTAKVVELSKQSGEKLRHYRRHVNSFPYPLFVRYVSISNFHVWTRGLEATFSPNGIQPAFRIGSVNIPGNK
jgi:hypothetical protein